VLPDTALAEIIPDRVRSLMSDPGIAVAMGALRGLIAAARDRDVSSDYLWCKREVTILANEHVSRNIRETARNVLRLY
jgi:hypothetical protein